MFEASLQLTVDKVANGLQLGAIFGRTCTTHAHTQLFSSFRYQYSDTAVGFGDPDFL